MTTCPACGGDNRPGARFCDACGSPLTGPAASAREERKIVTVLFADLVGFTARAEQLDPEDVRSLLQPYHARLKAELERFGGTVEKFIGDAVMALFGAPVAHEDDPERAVRAALSIRDWLREGGELQARIAVTSGEALVNLGARPDRGEGMASGDVVNTAARLQAAAPVNGILVGEQAYRATSHAVDYRELPPVEAKGKAEPVRVWEAVEARARFGVDLARGFDTPLVGRERELAVLRELLTRVREDRSPQLVTLVGMPGIGKSRLVYELMQMVEQSGVLTYWRQGRSLPYGDGVTFWALSEIVKAQCGILETDDAEQAEDKLARAVGELVESDDVGWLTQHLRPLVGLSTGAALSGDRREEAFVAWRRLFEAMAERRPLVLVLDDLQWADEGLLDFVDHLVDWTSGVALLVVATARTELLERRPGWGGGKLNTTTLALSPLSDAETERLLEPLLAAGLGDDVVHAVLARAGGNPLYAEQYARMLDERGATGDLPLPESVQGIVAARLDLLSRPEKSLLQDAAVFGKVFWLGGLATSRPRAEVEQELRALERKDFVQRARRSSVAGETEYSFRHLLVRDVAYAQIPRGLRAEKHSWAADWIASLGRPDDHAEMVAYHRVEALELVRAAGGETEALTAAARAAARDAGERALALNGFAIAARHFSDALASAPPGDPQRPGLLSRLGHALNLAGDVRADEMLTEASAALLATGDAAGAAETEARLAETFWLRGDHARQVEHLVRAQNLVRAAPPSEAKARVLAEVARFRMIARDNAQAIEIGREALAIAEAMGLRELEAHVLNSVGSARLEEDDAAGRKELERSIELAVAAGSPVAIHRGYNNLANEIAYGGDLRRSMALDAECLETTGRFGVLREVRFAQGIQVTNEFLVGRWERCVELADAFIAECEAGAAHYHEVPVRWVRSAVRLARDDVDGARRDLDTALLRGEQAKDAQVTLSALAFAVRLEVELDRVHEAEQRAMRWLDEYGAVAVRRPPFVDLVWAAPFLSRRGDIRAALAKGRQTRWHDACRAILDENYAPAAAMFGEIGCVVDEAYAHLRAAAAAVAAGEDAAAASHRDRALTFYRSVGAARYVREAEGAVPVSAT